MKSIILFLFCLLLITTVHAQQDSTYSYIYNCDSCGIFETVSLDPIELETEVDISSEVLTDTSTNTLAQFSSITLRKALNPINILRSHESYLNINPNPVKSNYYLNIESDKDCLAGILISDIWGRKVLSFTQKLCKGMNVIEQSSSKLNSGSFFVRVSFNNNIFVKKLIIQK